MKKKKVMKRLLFSLACMMRLCADIACADNEKVVTVSQLPSEAQQFLTRYFPESKVSLVKVESEFAPKTYEVYFANGDHVEFNGKGAWIEIECPQTAIHTELIPQPILAYVQSTYPDAKVIELKKERKEYEVKLSNRMELTFDKKFKLIDMDN